MCCSCGGADSRAQRGADATNRLSLKWQTPPNCHCEERSDVAISQYPAESQESYRRNRNCLPEIAPQGHFLALRAQGATAPTGPRNDKLGGIARSAALPNNRQPARRSLSAATGRLLVPAILMAAGTKRQCLPEIATGAERPRNDKFGSIVRSAMLPYNLPACKALAERRYRRNRFVRFIAALYGLQVPSRDCHVGLRPPRNDKLLVFTFYRQSLRDDSAAWGVEDAAPLQCAGSHPARLGRRMVRTISRSVSSCFVSAWMPALRTSSRL